MVLECLDYWQLLWRWAASEVVGRDSSGLVPLHRSTSVYFHTFMWVSYPFYLMFLFKSSNTSWLHHVQIHFLIHFTGCAINLKFCKYLYKVLWLGCMVWFSQSDCSSACMVSKCAPHNRTHRTLSWECVRSCVPCSRVCVQGRWCWRTGLTSHWVLGGGTQSWLAILSLSLSAKRWAFSWWPFSTMIRDYDFR